MSSDLEDYFSLELLPFAIRRAGKVFSEAFVVALSITSLIKGK
jgi:hypothetical protein